MPRVNGWELVVKDEGINSSTIWVHSEVGELRMLEIEERWYVLLDTLDPEETGEEGEEVLEITRTKQEALEFVEGYKRQNPRPYEERGRFDDAMFKLQIPLNPLNRSQTVSEDLRKYADRIRSRYGNVRAQKVGGGPMERGGAKAELVFFRSGEDGVPFPEDKAWLNELTMRAERDFGSAQGFAKEQPDQESMYF